MVLHIHCKIGSGIVVVLVSHLKLIVLAPFDRLYGIAGSLCVRDFLIRISVDPAVSQLTVVVRRHLYLKSYLRIGRSRDTYISILLADDPDTEMILDMDAEIDIGAVSVSVGHIALVVLGCRDRVCRIGVSCCIINLFSIYRPAISDFRCIVRLHLYLQRCAFIIGHAQVDIIIPVFSVHNCICAEIVPNIDIEINISGIAVLIPDNTVIIRSVSDRAGRVAAVSCALNGLTGTVVVPLVGYSGQIICRHVYRKCSLLIGPDIKINFCVPILVIFCSAFNNRLRV